MRGERGTSKKKWEWNLQIAAASSLPLDAMAQDFTSMGHPPPTPPLYLKYIDTGISCGKYVLERGGMVDCTGSLPRVY